METQMYHVTWNANTERKDGITDIDLLRFLHVEEWTKEHIGKYQNVDVKLATIIQFKEKKPEGSM